MCKKSAQPRCKIRWYSTLLCEVHWHPQACQSQWECMFGRSSLTSTIYRMDLHHCPSGFQFQIQTEHKFMPSGSESSTCTCFPPRYQESKVKSFKHHQVPPSRPSCTFQDQEAIKCKSIKYKLYVHCNKLVWVLVMSIFGFQVDDGYESYL